MRTKRKDFVCRRCGLQFHICERLTGLECPKCGSKGKDIKSYKRFDQSHATYSLGDALRSIGIVS